MYIYSDLSTIVHVEYLQCDVTTLINLQISRSFFCKFRRYGLTVCFRVRISRSSRVLYFMFSLYKSWKTSIDAKAEFFLHIVSSSLNGYSNKNTSKQCQSLPVF